MFQGRGLHWLGVSGVVEAGGQLSHPTGRGARLPPGSEGCGAAQQPVPLRLPPAGLHPLAPADGRAPGLRAELSPPS